MKLLSKLTLYITLSKTAIVLLFIWLLPGLVKDVALQYTNYSLKQQKEKVINIINRNGIDYYFQGDSSYGSYTMLKEEYISLDKAPEHLRDTIETSQRIIDRDTLTYRLLTHVFEYHHKKYLLEIGKTVDAINQYNRSLQRVALYVLIGLIVFTLLIDLIFTRLLLRPLGTIIRTKLLNQKFPFKDSYEPVRTSTTDFKYLDDSLISLMDKIKDAFEKEKEFTSNASHELLTPISILQNKMENMMDQAASEEWQEKIMGMMNTLNRLKKIVRSLLLISRIENDQFIKSDRVVISSLLEEVKNELEDRLEVRGIGLQIKLSGEVVLTPVNHDLLFQLIFNLINNAIRYNKENGSIVVRDQFMPRGYYTLIVEDTGVGILQGDLLTIFDRFRKSGTTHEEGYGLGLSIVKSIVVYHDMEIRVVSEPGKGTTFSILVPLRMVEAGVRAAIA